MTDTAVRIPPSTLRNRLRDAREFRDLDQIDIARELGISRATVSNYERGISTPGKLVINAWAVATNVDVHWLRWGTDPQPSDYKAMGVRSIARLSDRPHRRNDTRGPGSRAAA
jgi:transcriptional regulator with XRE-family HTH domain